MSGKQFPWSTIVEYFTKRGKPLSKDEIAALRDEDKRHKEEAEEEQKRLEQQEKMKMQK